MRITGWEPSRPLSRVIMSLGARLHEIDAGISTTDRRLKSLPPAPVWINWRLQLTMLRAAIELRYVGRTECAWTARNWVWHN